jgi:hypothetical protein
MSWQNFKSKILNSCPWSKDPEKQIKQINHYHLNRAKYNLDRDDLKKLEEKRQECYGILKQKQIKKVPDWYRDYEKNRNLNQKIKNLSSNDLSLEELDRFFNPKKYKN